MKKILFMLLFVCLSSEMAKAALWDIGKSVKKEKAERERAMLEAKTNLLETKKLFTEAQQAVLAAKKSLEQAQDAVSDSQNAYEKTKKFIASVDQEISKNNSLLAEQDTIITKAEKMIKKAKAFIAQEQQKIEQATLAKKTPELALTNAKKMQTEETYKELPEREKTIQEAKDKVALQKAFYQETMKNFEEKQAAYEHTKKLYNASIDSCKKGLPCSTSIPPKIG